MAVSRKLTGRPALLFRYETPDGHHETFHLPELRSGPLFREHDLHPVPAPPRLSSGGRGDVGAGARWRRLAGPGRAGRDTPLPLLPQCPARCLQLAGSGGFRGGLLPRLPAQPDRPEPRRAGEHRALASAGSGQAPALLQPAAPAPAAADPPGGPGARAGLRLQGGHGRHHQGHDRPRRRRDHHRAEGGRRRAARGDAQASGRGVPHPARPFPARDRAPLLGPAGGTRHEWGAGGLPRPLRRRAAGLSAGARHLLCQWRPGGLAGELCQRLCQRPSLGGLRRDLDALPAHRGHAGNGRRLRHQRASRRGAG